MSATQKLHGGKGPVPPLRELKMRPAEEREWAFNLAGQTNPATRQPLTNTECRALIKKRLGIALGSDGAYSDFRSWQLRWRLTDRLNQMAEDDEAALQDQFPGLSREKIREATIKRSYAMADLLQDPKYTLQVIKTDQNEESARARTELEQAKLQLARESEARQSEALKLAREKFESDAAAKMLDAALRRRAEEIATSNLSQADKIAAMRKVAFAEVDALQQSGAVQIPKA